MRKSKFWACLLLALCFGACEGETVFAATLANTNAAQYELNQASPGAMAKYQLGTVVIKQREHSLKCVYDFAVQGGAIGVHTLRDEFNKPCVVPNKAIIRDALIDVITAGTTSASGTMALDSNSAGDLRNALAAASYASGLVASHVLGTAATSIKMTADRTLTGTIATGALTAGKWNVLVKYQLSE